MTDDTFDPAAPAAPDSGLFGLGTIPEESRVHIIAVPWEATVSYRGGTAAAPAAILAASHQVDLFDIDTGHPYREGICLLDVPAELVSLHEAACRDVQVARTVRPDERAAIIDRIDTVCSRMNTIVRDQAGASLGDGRLVGLVGGDHSTPFGLIEALAARHPGMGILQFDAHHDLRDAYEGFTWSHASVMWNVLGRLDGVGRLVQVGVRDFSENERIRLIETDRRGICYYDQEIQAARFEGIRFDDVAQAVIDELPEKVYISFDVDGLEPPLCPNTGTPVPGGLRFDEAMRIVKLLVRSGREIIGFDVVEVAPGPGGLDEIVGARLLYKLLGFALQSRADN